MRTRCTGRRWRSAWRTGRPTPADRRRTGTTRRNSTSCCRPAAPRRCANWWPTSTAVRRQAGEIVAEAGLGRMACRDVSRKQAEQLLAVAREQRQAGHAEAARRRRSRTVPALCLCHVERDSVVRHRAVRRDPVSWSRHGPQRARTCSCWSASTARRSPATLTWRATSARSTCSAAGFATPSPRRRRTSTS